jgi:hypothetical protein
MEWNGEVWEAFLSATEPPPVHQHGLVYDAQRRSLILVGGYVSGVPNQEMWERKGTEWSVLPTFVPVQASRDDTRMAFDEKRNTVVVIKDEGNGGETWEWKGGLWNQVNSLTTPDFFNAALSYDETRQRVLSVANSFSDTGPAQTWEWNGAEWTLRASLVAPPSVNSGSVMAYDSDRQRAVWFHQQGGTWEWDGQQWMQRMPTTNPGAAGAARSRMVYDKANKRMTLFLDSALWWWLP